MKRTSIVIICIALAMSFIAATPEDPKPPKRNLRVLPKNIEHEELDKVMDNWKAALGVNCGFCHARSSDSTQRRLDFASDAKEEKEVARKMFKMTEKLNKKYFKHVGEEGHEKTSIALVTCATCHHGSPHPITKMPPQQRPERREGGEKH